MLNKMRLKAGRCFLLILSLAVLAVATVGCNNGTPDLGNATPKPPPSNIDPTTGKPRGEGGPPPGARGPRG